MTRGTRISMIILFFVLGALFVAGGVVYGALPSNSNGPPAGTGTGTAGQRLGQSASAKLSPQLLAQFQAQPAGAKLQYWVILADQADTSNNIPSANWADKGWYVYKALTQKAAATQPAVLGQLQALRSAGQVGAIQSFWIINSFVVTGDLQSAQTVATNPAVAKVREMGSYHLVDSPGTLSTQAQAVLNGALLYDRFQAPLLIQHNISEVDAPQAWTAGYDGTGITVGSMDTGTRWTHEALYAHYRGVVAPPDPAHIHDYNWFDGYNVYTTPTDNNGHGTHTMGTIVGTSPNGSYGNIGVAKGAQWITVRVCATGACDDTPILNGFQWTLAPTRVDGTDPRPDLRPRISSNSWGDSTCTDNSLQTAVTNWVNAGIFPDFANGNAGPGAGTVDAPASFANAWGTGALDTSTTSWSIASFSSRGPSCYDGSIRPQALAPGVNILSSYNGSDTDYQYDTGTSMATPQLAGAVAILQQKNPNLTIAQYEYALTSTAYFSPTWGTRPNNDYGWGLIQIDAALAAIPAGSTPTPTVTGTPPTATATATAPATATATATVCGAITYSDSVVSTDPTKHSVNGTIASTCAGGPCPGDLAGNFHYKAYQFTNPSASAVCVTVSYNQSCLYSDSYLSSFDPNNGCTNYLGAASGAGPTSYSFTVPGNATFWVVAEEYNINNGCANYSLTITGLPTSCPTPTSTPTNTPVPPTSTPTRTPTNTPTSTPTNTPVPPTSTPTRTPTNTPVPPTSTPTSTATPHPQLVGHVIWQGRPTQPNALQALPITLTLTTGGSSYSFTGLTTDANGNFTVDVNSMPNGVYTWRVKGPQYLSTSGPVTLNHAPSTPVEMGLQLVGDANNDNLVDISDFSILRATFGVSCGNLGYDTRADFNGDCLVDITDFTLLRGNFGQAGNRPAQAPPGASTGTLP